MDERRFDRLVVAATDPRSRRGLVRLAFGAVLGGMGLAAFGEDEAAAAKCRRGRKRCNGKCIKKSQPCTPPDRCAGPVGICNADPTPCGSVAGGGVCGCERAVEGNNVCINSGADNVCDQNQECTSTNGPEATSCRNLVGFHFFCQEAKTNQAGQFCGCGFGTATGRVCVPECDNPN
jgi:hypothetical protein